MVFTGIPPEIRISQNPCLPIILPQISQFNELYVTLLGKNKDMEQISQVIFEKNSIEFVTVAAEYCGFIERSQEFDKKTFVDTALKILPLLYLKASLIPECEQIGEDDLEIVVTEVEVRIQEDLEVFQRWVCTRHVWCFVHKYFILSLW